MQGKEHWRQERPQKKFIEPKEDVVHAEDQEDTKDQPAPFSSHIHHSGLIVLPLQVGFVLCWGREVLGCDRIVFLLGGL